jgi:uncharacterized membrane protein YhaH (DUF805 family)
MSATIGLWEHFKRLFDFKGREDRASFWPYAALVFGFSVVGMFAVMIPAMATTMGKMQRFAAEHPDQVNVVSGPGQYSMTIEGNHPELMPDFTAMIGGVTIITLVVVLLYVAAVVRRLHDRDRSGWWGLMPIPFLLFSFIQMPRFFSIPEIERQPDLGVFFSVLLSNMLYLIALVALIVLLAGASTSGPNRYDAEA